MNTTHHTHFRAAALVLLGGAALFLLSASSALADSRTDARGSRGSEAELRPVPVPADTETLPPTEAPESTEGGAQGGEQEPTLQEGDIPRMEDLLPSQTSWLGLDDGEDDPEEQVGETLGESASIRTGYLTLMFVTLQRTSNR